MYTFQAPAAGLCQLMRGRAAWQARIPVTKHIVLQDASLPCCTLTKPILSHLHYHHTTLSLNTILKATRETVLKTTSPTNPSRTQPSDHHMHRCTLPPQTYAQGPTTNHRTAHTTHIPTNTHSLLHTSNTIHLSQGTHFDHFESQVKYVVELAKALGRIPSVARVDLLTRLICDPKVDKSYGVAEERLNSQVS